MPQDPKVWLITGAAGGFGRALVDRALADGAFVVATARDPAVFDDMLAAHAGRLMPLRLDVAHQRSIDEAIARAESRFGGIDVLVNNAGYGLIAAVEEATDAETRLLLETHLFGTIGTIRAALPGMRARGAGHIVNFSSLAGLTGGAGTALYSAAKWGVEGLSEGLAKELAPLGIKVTIVEPGPFQTNFFTTSRRMGERRMTAYDATAGAYRDRAGRPDLRLPGDPERGARAIAEIVAAPEPPLRLLLGRFAYDVALATLDAHRAEIERWKDLTIGADYPDAAGRPWP